MNRSVDIPSLNPIFIRSTQFPNSFDNGSVDSGNKASVTPSYRSSIPPLSPYSQIPTTRQPIASQNFIPDSTLPPRMTHRRSNSDIISGLNSLIHPSEKKGVNGEAMDELFSAYMNLDRTDVFNGNDMERNMSDSNGNKIVSKRTTGVKRRAGKNIAPSSRHCRNVSMDTSFIVNSSFGEESTKLPSSPGNLQNWNAFSLEFGDSTSEMKKIVDSDKLTDLAVSNPKIVKRILANRQSAARSKERKAQYVSELELEVETLQTEAASLSSQIKHCQRDKILLEIENQELRISVQEMEQQEQLQNILIKQLTGEVQRLEVSQNRSESDRSQMQNVNMFQQLNINQLHQPNEEV